MLIRPFFQKLSSKLSDFSAFIAMITMISMMLLITSDVIMNKLIGRPIPGTVEVTAYYFMVLLVFLALPYIEKKQSHISADFLVVMLPESWQDRLNAIGKILTIIFYTLLAYGAVLQAVKSTKRLETAMSNFTFYIWPSRWGVVFGLVSAICVLLILIFPRNHKKR